MFNKILDNDASQQLLDDSVTSSQYTGSTNLFSGVNDANNGEDVIRKKLEWYFKTPFEKYKEKQRKPFKFLLQIIKIILISVQATLFAVDEFSLVDFNKENLQTFRNVFILGYDNSDSSGIKNLYTVENVYTHMLYTWKQYYNYDDIMLGSYNSVIKNDTLHPIHFCKEWNKKVQKNLKFYPDANLQSSSVLDGENDDSIGRLCYYLKAPKISADETTLKEFIADNNLPQTIVWILSMQLNFSFHMNYSSIHRRNSPDCSKFDIKLLFDNQDLDGIMTVALYSTVDFGTCRKSGGLHIREADLLKSSQTVFDFVVILICIISFSLCVCSFRKHFKLCLAAVQFFKEYRHETFTLSDKMNFISFWLVLIAICDIFALSGSVLKIAVDWLEYPELNTACSIFFGVAVLLSWIGILRYLGFMKGYNTLLVTLKVAFPTIMRFICCVLLIYIGFVICGWIVLGPYHEKFTDLSLSSECLYSLLNGDDMFRTFTLLYNSDPLIYYFSKFYLYIFISLFIFVVLSLFIGIVADTFERIKEKGCAPKTRVELFMQGEEYNYVIGNHSNGANDVST